MKRFILIQVLGQPNRHMRSAAVCFLHSHHSFMIQKGESGWDSLSLLLVGDGGDGECFFIVSIHTIHCSRFA